jgi:hypothetical protein
MIDPTVLTSVVLALVISPMMVPAAQQQGQRGQSPAPFQPPVPAQGMHPPEISGFSVVLVVGETQASSGSGSGQDLPAGAQRALSDMREFLPYKHYRVLDSQWTSCCSPRSRATVAGRLQGVAGVPGPQGALNLVPRNYAFSITAGTSAPSITTRFVLGLEEPGRGVPPERMREFERERQDLKSEIELAQTQMVEMQRRVEVGAVSASELPVLRNRHDSLRRKLSDLELTIEEAGSPGAGRPIIDSSFTMAAGETVVVGTSKLGGDKALIALVTAVRKNTTSKNP